MDNIKIILADDHSILRYGLRMFLTSADDITIAGEASTGQQCLELFEEHRPDVCLIDIGMPEKNGIEIVRAIRDKDAETKIIFLSMHSDEATLRRAFSVNIDGYLLKDTPKQNILDAIRAVHDGEEVFSDDIPQSLLRSNKTDEPPLANGNITKRESEIISLVVAGYNSREIAEKLFISPRTVDTHRNNIMQKLNISNTASLVRLALENDWVDSPTP